MIKKYGLYVLVFIVGMTLGHFFLNNLDSKKYSDDVHNISHSEWTCSMHPQVTRVDKGLCPLCLMELVQKNSINDLSIKENQFVMSDDAIALANVETTLLEVESSTSNTVRLSGKITANQKTNTIQTTLFDGRIDKMSVNFVGEYVRKGQQIGLIYSPELYLAQDKLLTSASYKDTHEKLYNAARNSLGLWKMTDNQIDEILKTGKPMMNFPLYADASGTVTEIIAAEGNFYKQGDALFKLSKLNTVWAVFDVYENQLSNLKVRQKITINSNALKGKKIEAKVNFIEPFVNTSSRTISLRVTLTNTNGLLKPGMFVEGQLEAQGDDSNLMVPKSAIMWTGKRSLIYRKPHSDQHLYEMLEVTLGNSIGEKYVILDGIEPGDEIVTNGTFTIDAAAQLQGKKSMMSKYRKLEDESIVRDGNSIIDLNIGTKKEFLKIIHSYVEVKDALVASKFKDAKTKAKTLHSGLLKIELGLVDNSRQKSFEKLIENSKKIVDGKNLSEQRKHFKFVSKDMIDVVSSVNDLAKVIYIQFCPMADNNKGADWLSFESEIKNPYFGDTMLTCGRVKAQIN